MQIDAIEGAPACPRLTYLIEDDPALRRLVRRMLANADTEIFEFETAKAFAEGYCERPIGCVLLDLHLPDNSGLDLLEHIAQLDPPNPIIMISGQADIPAAVAAMKLGALDFLPKPFRKNQLLDVVGKCFDRIEGMERTVQELQRLTPREREILVALRDGAPNKVIAAQLNLSPRTVEMHRARVFKKLGVSNLAQALSRAREFKLIS